MEYLRRMEERTLENSQKRKHGGFTLIELMMVSAIIGLLASIAIPKFANMIIKAKEATVRGKLGSLRSAVSIYYADMEGIFPAAVLTTSLVPKHIVGIPSINIPTVPVSLHSTNNEERSTPPQLDWLGNFAPTPAAWFYVSTGGVLAVNCSHTDSTGRVWSTW